MNIHNDKSRDSYLSVIQFSPFHSLRTERANLSALGSPGHNSVTGLFLTKVESILVTAL